MSSRRIGLVALAIVYAGLNAPKPLHIDDGAYSYYAHQMAAHPLDPYGFSLLWYDAPDRANEVLTPPVLPATWAAALALVGERPWLWKLLLVGWPLLLVWGLDRLYRRFTPGLEAPLLVLTVLSPAFLPSLNLMLDVPALALSLAAIELFLGACDRDSFGRAIVAGLVAGLAMETKYTSFATPGVMLLAAALRHRWRLGLPAAAAAVQVFVVWEFLVAVLYGESHFLYAVRLRQGGSLADKLPLILPLFETLGGLLPAVILLGLAALGASGRWLAAAGGVVVAGFAALALFGPGKWDNDYKVLRSSDIVFSAFALAGLAVLFGVVARLWATDEERTPSGGRDTMFLLGWLGMEVAAYFALSPFPAVRRLLGIVVVLTLLVGRLASRTCGRRLVWAITAGGVVLGLGFYAVDLREAQVHEAGADAAADWVRDHGGGRVWYLGHWGFQYAADRRGMSPVVADYAPTPGAVPLLAPTLLRAGDWLVVPSSRIHAPSVRPDDRFLEPAVSFTFEDPVPLRTTWCYYIGRTPLERHLGPRLGVVVYRVTADFVPQLSP